MSPTVFEYYFEPEDLGADFVRLIDRFGPTVGKRNWAEKVQDALSPPPTLHVQPETKQDAVQPLATQNSPVDTVLDSTRLERQSLAVVDSPLSQDVEPATSESESKRRSRLRRFISVHALGQYVFCLRSAVLSLEIGDQRDLDEPMPRLTYIPNFDREKIEEALSKELWKFGLLVLASLAIIGSAVVGISTVKQWHFHACIFCLACVLYSATYSALRIVELALRRHAAIAAEAREPEPQFDRIARVNWWSLLKCGYEPVSYERPFRHAELPIEGCPWRVLQQGNRRIPVIKAGSSKIGFKRGELYSKHQVRLVAYALLLESSGPFVVPYGVVLPTDSALGLAFPITDELRCRAIKLIGDFDRQLAQVQHDQMQPKLPEPKSRCSRCDYGSPTQISASEIVKSRKTEQPIVVLRSPRDVFFHCQCADRFGSAPPHERITRMGLSQIVG